MISPTTNACLKLAARAFAPTGQSLGWLIGLTAVDRFAHCITRANGAEFLKS